MNRSYKAGRIAGRVSILGALCLAVLTGAGSLVMAQEHREQPFFKRLASYNPASVIERSVWQMEGSSQRGRGLLRGLAPSTSRVIKPRSSSHLAQEFRKVNFLLHSIESGVRDVPRLYVTRLPDDLRSVDDTAERKKLFIKTLLPLILMANEELAARRDRLVVLLERMEKGERLSRQNQRWLTQLAEDYEVAPGDYERLLRRVDGVPTSLALAQAIEESGWGTSRFAIEGNALFGQKTYHGHPRALRAKQAPGVQLRGFRDLMESVRSYMHNLNTHKAYAAFRTRRAQDRLQGQDLNAGRLADSLTKYATSKGYPQQLRRLMKSNALETYDRVGLVSGNLGGETYSSLWP